jgi:hypothetical protein
LRFALAVWCGFRALRVLTLPAQLRPDIDCLRRSKGLLSALEATKQTVQTPQRCRRSRVHVASQSKVFAKAAHMDWTSILAIALMLTITVTIWYLNRYYERNGVIFAVPFSIKRDRTPTFFRLTMILNWIVFAFVACFTLLLTIAIISARA